MKVPVSSRAGRVTGICREIRLQKYSCESNNWHTRLDTEVNHPTARWHTSSKGQKSLNRNRNRRSTFKRRLSKDVACSLVAGSHWGKQAGFQRRGCPLTPVNVSSAGAWRGQSQKRHAGHQAPPRGSDSKKALASYHRAAGPALGPLSAPHSSRSLAGKPRWRLLGKGPTRPSATDRPQRPPPLTWRAAAPRPATLPAGCQGNYGPPRAQSSAAGRARGGSTPGGRGRGVPQRGRLR